MQIGIVKSTGQMMGDRVLKGVYGQHTPGESEGAMAGFKVAPEFDRISHLFGYLKGGAVPIAPTSVAVLDVEDRMEHTVKALLMRSLAMRWASMYNGVMPEEPGPLGMMLKAESTQVAQGAKNHLLSMGMRGWMVPIKYKVLSASIGTYLATEQDLLADLQRCRPQEIEVDLEAAPTDLGTDVLNTGHVVTAPEEVQQTAPETPAEPAPQAPPTAWANFSGIEAQVKGGIVVVAQNAEMAVEAARFCLQQFQSENPAPVSCEVIITSLVSVADRQLEAVQYRDEDEDEDFPRERE